MPKPDVDSFMKVHYREITNEENDSPFKYGREESDRSHTLPVIKLMDN